MCKPEACTTLQVASRFIYTIEHCTVKMEAIAFSFVYKYIQEGLDFSLVPDNRLLVYNIDFIHISSYLYMYFQNSIEAGANGKLDCPSFNAISISPQANTICFEYIGHAQANLLPTSNEREHFLSHIYSLLSSPFTFIPSCEYSIYTHLLICIYMLLASIHHLPFSLCNALHTKWISSQAYLRVTLIRNSIHVTWNRAMKPTINSSFILSYFYRVILSNKRIINLC